MAGIVDTTLTNDQTVQGYEQQAEALDVAREDLRGMQKGTLKDLFNYDKALSERYSSPDSKMYLENAADRERAITGYSDIARGEVSNLYDIMQGVSKARQDLLERVEMLKEQAKKASAGAGGGQTGFSPSALLSVMRSTGAQTEQPPEPPSKMVQEVMADPQKKIYWAKNDNGTYAYTVDSATAPRKDTAEIYQEYKDPDTIYQEQQSQEDELLDTFGIDRQQLAKLASLEVLDPQLAQSELRKLMIENATAKPKELTADDYKAGVKATDSKKVREQKMEAYYSSPQAMDATTQKEYNFQRSAILNAKKLQDLYAQRKAGEISESDFRIKSTNYATSLARAILRKESGATITMQEWQTVMPSIPRVNFRNQNALERITGQMPEILGVKDNEKTATTKLDDFLEEQYTLNPRLRNEFEKNAGEYQYDNGNIDENIKGKLVQSGVVYADDGSIDFSQMPADQIDELPSGMKVPKALYSLIVEPIVKGVQGYATLVGTAAGVAMAPTLAKMWPKEQYNELEDWLTSNVDTYYSTPGKTALNAGLQTLGGVGAAFDIGTLGAGGTVKAVAKNAVKMGLRNTAINAPLFGIGSALEAIREGENPETIGKRFIEGTTGQRFTGPFVGLLGRSPETETADVVTTIIGPIVGPKIIKGLLRGNVGTDVGDGLETAKQGMVDMPDHEVQFAKAFSDGDTTKARQIADSLSDGNPYKKIYNEALITAENAGDTARQSGGLRQIFQDTRSRLAGTLFNAEPESIAKSEDLAKKAIGITKSKTLYGMAKEMPEVRRQAGAFVDANVGKLDKAIGPMSMDEIIDDVMTKVMDTSAAQANPDMVEKQRAVLRKLLYSGMSATDSDMARKGAVTQTTLSQINTARKSMNRSINSNWFSNGMPTTSNTENTNAIKWVMSQALKDIIKETDDTGSIAKAIETEHISFATEPVISKLLSNRKFSIKGSSNPLTMIGNVISGAFNLIWEPARIMGVRATGDEGLKGFRNVIEGAGDTTTSNAINNAIQQVEPAGFTRKPLQPDMVEIIASNKAKKASAQTVRYLGEQAENLVGTRGQQDKALRRLKSIKYK